MDTPITRDEVGAMFDAVAPRYDLLNRVLSLGVDRRWRRDAVRALALRAGDLLVDICGGTGDLALEAARQTPGVRTVNLDLSSLMLRRYATRTTGANGGGTAPARAPAAGAPAVVGDAMQLPLRGGAATAAIVGFGIRNVPDRRRALAEMHRLLAPGGRLVILEFALPAPAIRGPYLFYLRHVMPRVAALLSPSPAAYRYLGDSIAAFPAAADFAAMIEDAGFCPVTWAPLSCGIAVRYLAIKP
jgi:demethylmenaquinone methyltransferase/2-methoxy-6-polyprenyl-1,4-benzoquinol methylase